MECDAESQTVGDAVGAFDEMLRRSRGQSASAVSAKLESERSNCGVPIGNGR